MSINRITGTFGPERISGALSGPTPTTAPTGTFQVMLDHLVAAGESGGLQAQYATLRDIAAKYDPRDLSFNERREMIRELKEAGFLSVEAAAVATAYVRPSDMIRQPGESQAAYQARLDEWRQSNPAFDQKVDYMGHLWWRASTFGPDPATAELMDVMKTVLSVRQNDPALSDLPAPPARTTVDPTFRVDQWQSSGAGNEMLISSDYDDELAKNGYRLELRLVLQWVRKAVGLDSRDEDDDDKTEEAEAAEEAAAADEQESDEEIKPAEEAASKAETKDKQKSVEEEWEQVRMAIVMAVQDDPMSVHLDRLALAMLGGVDDTEGEREGSLTEKIRQDLALDTDRDVFTQIAKDKALQQDQDLVILRNDGGFHQGWKFSIDGMAKLFAQMATDEDADEAQLLPGKMLAAEVRVSDLTEAEAEAFEPTDAEKVAEFRGDGDVAWI